MSRFATILLLAVLMGNDCLSQQYPFIHYTPKDGLVNNRARFMYQDRHGLLYISTFGGLSVYDGSRFTNYNTDNGLSTNIVNDIVEMGDDSLWIIPNLPKLHCLVKGRISNIITSDGFYPVINKMIRCSNGIYYALADEGLFRFEKNHFIKVDLIDSAGRNAGRFLVNATEKGNKLFLTTDFNILPEVGPGRLIIYNLENNKVLVSPSFFAHFILNDPQGNILVSSRKGIKKIDETALSQNMIRLVAAPDKYEAAINSLAVYMYFDRQQNLWLTTPQGVLRIDQDGGSKLFSVKNGLSMNEHVSVFQDKENTMWFVNGQTGISKLVNPQFEFYPRVNPGFTANDLYADKKTDSVWLLDALHDKILLWYGNKTTEFQLSQPAISPPYKAILSEGNRYYLADLYNIYECIFLPNKKVKLTVIYAVNSQIPAKGFTCVLPDWNGNLLASSEDLTILLKNKKPFSYPLGYFTDHFILTDDHLLWIVTRIKKIYAFRLHPENPDQYLEFLGQFSEPIPSISPRSITTDQKGNVWVGSREHGLFFSLFNGKTFGAWRQITSKDGLSDNFISYLHTDAENNIWACTPAGLDKIQLRKGSFYIENITSANNIYQYAVKIQTSKDSVQWVLTGAGIIRIAPTETRQNDFQPKILFREILDGKNRSIRPSDALSLTASENNLSFSVAAPSFMDEKQIRFSYLLAGSGNESWSNPSTQSIIHFVNLSPGKYILKAKAIFVNGRYPDSEISCLFNIAPPWWQTWWFKSLLWLTVFSILLLVIRTYYRGKLKKQRFEFEKREAIKQERTRIATDMHDDLGAGLARIHFLSESIRRKKTADQSILPEIGKISTYSDEMIEKMGEIVWALNEKNDTMADLIAFTRSYAVDYLQNHEIEYQVEAPAELPQLFIKGETRRTIFLSVKECLYNIVKHAHASMVTIRFEMNQRLIISIADNGKGIDWERIRPHANGLANIRKRIESVKGQVDFISDNGTTVKLSIPMTLAPEKA